MSAPSRKSGQTPDHPPGGPNDKNKEGMVATGDTDMTGTDQEQGVSADGGASGGQPAGSEPTSDQTSMNQKNRKKHAEISRVLKCNEKDYYGILGVDKKCKADEVRKAYKKLGLRTHPDQNKGNAEAERAFKKIGTAYTVLGERSSRRQYDKDHEKYQVPEEVNPQNLWDEEFHDNAFDGDTDPPSSDEEDDLDVDPNVKPDDQTLRIYRTATPVVAKYLSGEREAAYDNELERFNVALKKGNKGRKLAEDRFLISINVLKAISIELNHVFEAARKKEGRLDRQKLSVLEEQLEKIKRTYAYPEGWAIIIPKDVEEISSARKDDNSPSTSSSHTESVPETSSASQATSAPETTSVATLLPKQVQEVQTETQTVWKRMKWNTHSTSNGDTILAYKALSRLGNDPYGYEFVVMTKQSPYFEVMTGSEIGRRTRDDYLALPNIYKINTDPGDDKTPRYSYRDKKKYDRLLFAATKPRKLAKAGGVPRTGDTQCCIMWKDGTVAIMARAHFKKVADEDESSAIAVFCESLDTPPPWNRDPKALPVPTNTPLGQELLRAGRSGSLLSISSLSGSKGDLIPASNSGGTTDVALITNLQSSVSSVQASLEAMESRVENKMAKMMEHISAQQEELKLQREESNKINAGLMQVLSKLNLGS